jgi:hypothetical protein
MNRWMIEAAIAGLAGIALWGFWIHHDSVEQKLGEQRIVVADQKARDEQKAVDDKRIAQADATHAKELDDLKTAYLNEPVSTPPHIVCYTIAPHSSGTAQVQPDQNRPTGDGTQGSDVSKDLFRAIDVLAHRVDQLNADARQLNMEVQ